MGDTKYLREYQLLLNQSVVPTLSVTQMMATMAMKGPRKLSLFWATPSPKSERCPYRKPTIIAGLASSRHPWTLILKKIGYGVPIAPSDFVMRKKIKPGGLRRFRNSSAEKNQAGGGCGGGDYSAAPAVDRDRGGFRAARQALGPRGRAHSPRDAPA